MSHVTDRFREHHRHLSKHLQEQVEALVEDHSDFDAAAFASFLKDDLLPHAHGEEKHLYPAVDPLVKQHQRPTATMSIDHEAIQNAIFRIAETADSLKTAGVGQAPYLKSRLQRLALQLEAVFLLHLEKEERIYLPLLEKHLSEDVQHHIMHSMHEGHCGEHDHDESVLDVREMRPRDRHPLVFRTFEALEPGGSFILVNDHDPKPLYYQFEFERKGKFTWEYLAQGPEEWRVRIAKNRAD